MKIEFTKESHRWGWLSNFSPHGCFHQTYCFSTSEHLFQALKTKSLDEMHAVRLAGGPAAAKKAGRRVTLRDNWDEIKLDCMRLALRAKVDRNPELKEALLGTGDAELVELTYWHDQYWGICGCPKHEKTGENWLGRLWMELRAQLQETWT